MNQIDYTALSDKELLAHISADDNKALDFLLNKYKNLVRAISKEYFIIGADKEDLIQEGMIGLYKAIRDFDIEKENSFFTFAKLCITRNIFTAIKSATRQKNIILNNSEMLDIELESNTLNPEEDFIDKESTAHIEENIMHTLSELELKVLNLHLQNYNYEQIAQILGNKDVKSVDNALQRARKKIGKIIRV